jgi:hypothetical protein
MEPTETSGLTQFISHRLGHSLESEIVSDDPRARGFRWLSRESKSRRFHTLKQGYGELLCANGGEVCHRHSGVPIGFTSTLGQATGRKSKLLFDRS